MSPTASAASASISAGSIDASDDLAVTALLSHVLESPGLVCACMAYQDGIETLLYEDGDVAAGQGHLSLLRLRRALCRKGKGSKGSASDSSNEGGGGGDSTGDAEEKVSATGRRGTSCGSGSMEEEDEDGKQGAETMEEVLLLEDLRFSHRAADWAAAQGHLEVVRCVSFHPTNGFLYRVLVWGQLY